MASSSSNNSTVVSKDSWLRSFMDKQSLKEDGSNFADWEMTLKMAAQGDGKERFLVDPVPPTPAINASLAVKNAHAEFLRESGGIKNILIFAMAPAL